MDIHNSIASLMSELGLQISAEQLASLCLQAGRQSLDNLEFLTHIISHLLEEKRHRSFDILLKFSGIRRHKDLDSFDFNFQPELDEALIRQLANLDFVKAKENIIFLAKPGRGKSHLASALGLCGLRKGLRVYMASLTQIIERLQVAQRTGTLTNRRWSAFVRPSVLIIDDVASRQLDRNGCELFAELISRRYEKGSIIITSNRPFSEWPKLYDSRAAEEIVDKLVHHSTIITIKGPSFRLKEKLQQIGSLN
jgi:DNA replication protein DnaC